MLIQAISWTYLLGPPPAINENFELYMGLCSSDVLTNSFEGNYVSGSKILVFDANPLIISPDGNDWSTITLETPYWYNGQDNLIIELLWDNATNDNAYYSGQWDSGANRMLYQQTTPVLNLSSWIPHMRLSGDLSLSQSTFAEIKYLLGK